MSKLYFCTACKVYTMKTACPKCTGNTIQAKPPKYSPEDKYGALRRKAKSEAQ